MRRIAGLRPGEKGKIAPPEAAFAWNRLDVVCDLRRIRDLWLATKLDVPHHKKPGDRRTFFGARCPQGGSSGDHGPKRARGGAARDSRPQRRANTARRSGSTRSSTSTEHVWISSASASTRIPPPDLPILRRGSITWRKKPPCPRRLSPNPPMSWRGSTNWKRESPSRLRRPQKLLVSRQGSTGWRRKLPSRAQVGPIRSRLPRRNNRRLWQGRSLPPRM